MGYVPAILGGLCAIAVAAMVWLSLHAVRHENIA